MSDVRFDTKQKLIEKAALDLFLEKGFEHTTLEAVAERLGYTKQAIYYYYKGKEDLVTSFCLSILTKAEEDIRGICGGGKKPRDTIRDLVLYTLNGTAFERGFFTLHNSMHRIFREIRDEARAAEIRAKVVSIPAMIMETIRKGVADGSFRSEDPYTLSLIIAGMINGVILSLDARTGRQDVSGNANELAANIIMKGIGA